MAGGNNVYSDKVMILIHIVVHFFRIGLRQAVGFVKGCIKQMGKYFKVISYTQASRRFKRKVIDMRYSNVTTLDYRPACDMLKGVEGKYNIVSVRADVAYYKASICEICKEYNIKPIIRPIKGAKIYEKIDCQLERNNNIIVIKLCKDYENDTKKWKQETKYELRSFIECFFYRLKKTFGFSLKNKSEINREKELLIKCYLLNKFTDIGMAKFELAT